MTTKLYFFSLVILLLLFAKDSSAQSLEIPTQVTKAAILIASSKGLGQSSFGHAYLRFTDQNIFTSNDIVAEFVADQGDEPVSLLKGLGLTQDSYFFKLNFTTYASIQQEMNRLNNRDLTTYPLKLSNSELQNLIAVVNSKKSSIREQKYLFLSQNCASSISSIIDQILGNSPGGLSAKIPNLLDQRYANVIDSSQVIVDLAFSSRRKILVDKEFPTFIPVDMPLYQNIREQLRSDMYTHRILGLLKLLKAERYLKLNRSQLFEVFVFLNRYAILESVAATNEFLDLINSRSLEKSDQQVRLVPLFERVDELSMRGSSERNKLIDHQFKINNGIPMISFQLRPERPSQDTAESTLSFNIDLTRFGFSVKRGRIYYGSTEIGEQFSSNIFGEKIFQDHFLILSEVIATPKWNYFLPYIAIEISPNEHSSNLNAYPNLDSKNILSFANDASDGSVGNCESMVEIEKRLLERVTFAPELSKLTRDENTHLLELAISGQVVIVPGFLNIWEWTKSMDQMQLQIIAKNFSAQISQPLKNLLNRTKLDAANIEDLDHALSHGITVPIYFRVHGNVAHALLIYEIKDMGDHYSLGYYDPNFGAYGAGNTLNPVSIEKRTGRLTSKLYAPSGTDAYANPTDLRLSLRYRTQILRKDFSKLVQGSLQHHQFAFQLHDLEAH